MGVSMMTVQKTVQRSTQCQPGALTVPTPTFPPVFDNFTNVPCSGTLDVTGPDAILAVPRPTLPVSEKKRFIMILFRKLIGFIKYCLTVDPHNTPLLFI
ncbi:hypothetical protein O3P69_003187 [Scylla paramamosain]|uniref:Uncharacterized protein n=1 Tax=Scylla paramamosain TaxID=85552 RepID=A0AAW0UJQ0_SCYPA